MSSAKSEPPKKRKKLKLTNHNITLNETEDETMRIKDVWSSNLEEELMKISNLLPSYNVVSMDTEFPGFLKTNENTPSMTSSYDLIKQNVDRMKLIQVGITLADQEGNHPEGVHTWQFNFKFDLR